ncbi:MAG TPA: hypothetical protein VGF18_10295 [Candidatus Tumulicola sp.]|jgi:hypothetical protein
MMRIFAVFALVLACAAPAYAEILNEQDAVALSGVVQDRLAAQDINVHMVGELPYAIAYWPAGKGYGGGQALAKKSDGTWTVVKVTSASFDASKLKKLGVPDGKAKALIADLKVAGQ